MKKILLSIVIWLITSICTVCFAQAGTNYVYFTRSWETLKLYCDYPISVFANTSNSNAFLQYNINIIYSWSDITLTKRSIPSDWDTKVNDDLWTSWYYVQYWSTKWPFVWQKELFSFNIKTKKNINSTEIVFKNLSWNDTVWKAWLSLYNANSMNVLDSFYNATYYFKAYPCTADWATPKLLYNDMYSGATAISWSKNIVENAKIKFTVYDGSWSQENIYWFSWNTANYNGPFTNYRKATSSEHVDNQMWVNSGTISVEISCPTCANWTKQELTEANSWLTVTRWWWNGNYNAYTWDSHDRWYEVSFNAPFNYDIEKEVIITWYASDNPNENWDTHTWHWTIKFNKWDNPEMELSWKITTISPKNTNPVKIQLTDDWAWIDTWSIWVRVSYTHTWENNQIENTWYIINSWNYTTYTWRFVPLSSNPVDCTEWNACGYVFEFYPPEDFPESSTVVVTWYIYDLAENSWELNWNITTRMPCSAYGCQEMFMITLIWENLWFTWARLNITWTRLESPYPYLTWENNEILMCGVENWTWVVINGWANNYEFTWEILYITWLDSNTLKYQDWKIMLKNNGD